VVASRGLSQNSIDHPELQALPQHELLQRRYDKFRSIGRVLEAGAQEPVPAA
jgi:acetyl-CoA carboxylase alpha subunit